MYRLVPMTMPATAPQFRRLKQHLRQLLVKGDISQALVYALDLPPRRMINPLLACLHDIDPTVKWPAVVVTGAVVARLADMEREAARVIMRRLFWNLNDESGGIGWGAPEALGEIMACHAPLAREYGHLLIALIRPEAGFVAKIELLHCILWGIGRLVHAWPKLVSEVVPDFPLLLAPYLTSSNVICRGLGTWIATAAVSRHDLLPLLNVLQTDHSSFDLFRDHQLQTVRISDLIMQADLSRHSYSTL